MKTELFKRGSGWQLEVWTATGCLKLNEWFRSLEAAKKEEQKWIGA